jgi:microcystin-dependent protein
MTTAYVPVGWDAITLLSGKNLNQMATIYACAKTFTDVHNHDSDYYTETQIDAKCFSNDGLLPDADMIDGKHWDEIIIDFLPVGFVCFWEGTSGTIPTGWHECDGSTVNGIDLPDIRNRFVMGAGAVHAALSTGGNATLSTVAGNGALESHVLSSDELPIHYHKWNDVYNPNAASWSPTGFSEIALGTESSHDTQYNHSSADAGHTHGNASLTLDEFSIMPPYIVKVAICKVE